MWLCDSATFRVFLVPGWTLPGGCGPAWLAAGWGWSWLAGAGPSWRLAAIARCDPALAWRAWAGGLQHTQHTLTKLTPPLTSMR